MSVVIWKRCLLIIIGILTITTVAKGEKTDSKKCPQQELILPCRCLSRGEELQVWCSHSDLPRILAGLHALGTNLHHSIDELILENNHLPSMPGRAFLPLRIMRLMLRYNGLERLSSDWLTGLDTSLMELFIVEPTLRTLPAESLSNLHRLEAVTIQTGLMKRLPDFSSLPALRYLQLHSTSLVELAPRHFRNLPRLEELHVIGSRRLEKLDAGLLQDLPRLKLVNITECGLVWLHLRAIARLPSLVELSLVGNKILDAGMIGRAARELPALETLRLDFNEIDRLGEAAFVDLPVLKTLTLANNRITELQHGAFHRVPQLRTVDLNHNRVRRVHPESFLQRSGSGLEELWLIDNEIGHVSELRALLDALPRLKFLDMSHNSLEAIPFGALRGHATLERLHLDYNKIQMIEREAFMAMPALRELRLRNNSLSDWLTSPMWNLPALKGLDLSGNFFRRIEPALLANLPTLKKLDLATNRITLIDPLAFLATPELELVNVSQNALATVHPATFRHLRNLYELDMSDNRLVEFVPGLPRGIEKLHMHRNVIPAIPHMPSPDLDLPALRMLDISSNILQRIDGNTLRSLPQLRRLYAGNNALRRLDEQALTGLNRLEVLDLSDNRLGGQLTPNAFAGLVELRELNLRDNRLDILTPDNFKDVPTLKGVFLSRNQITEILPSTFANTREVQYVDLSHNGLVALPSSLHGMTELKALDLTDNRLKTIQTDTLSSLVGLEKLQISRNYLQHLPSGGFSNLPRLKTLSLDNNEIEHIEPQAISVLPSLKSLTLSHNKLQEIPNSAFYDLPTLQELHLQENGIQLIADNAFHKIPHLLALNLSRNHLGRLEDAGLRSLRSLEMLDLSGNRLTVVHSDNFERMEWLVELRLDDNRICAVQGATFNRMPRLRVLSLRNNRLTSFPEYAVRNLRGNLAVLDIDGNPLNCDCNLLWLRAWLQESSLMGPRCLDGSLLRESRLSRQDCPEDNNLTQDPDTNPEYSCEAEILTTAGGAPYATSQVFASSLISNRTKYNHAKNSLIAPSVPSPEESDYFYDEYIDYPYNGTQGGGDIVDRYPQQISSSTGGKQRLNATTISSHYITGDTPVLYAATNRNKSSTAPGTKKPPKEIVGSPSSSGFTFFGVPLPSLSLNSLLGNSRMESTTTKSSTSSTSTRRPTKSSTPQTAERKTAIVNSPPRTNLRPPAPPYPQATELRPTAYGNLPSITLNHPEIITGGFIPVLPGASGGFKPFFPETHDSPLVKKMTKANYTSVSIEKVNVAEILPTAGSTFFPSQVTTGRVSNTTTNMVMVTTTEKIPVTISTQKVFSSTQNLKEVLREPTVSTIKDVATTEIKPSLDEDYDDDEDEDDEDLDDVSNSSDTTARIQEIKQIQNLSEILGVSSSNKVLQNAVKKPPPLSLDLTTQATKFEDIFKEVVDNVSLPTDKEAINPLGGDLLSSFSTNNDRKTSEHNLEKTPLSALLVPGGQQPQYRPPSAGRPTITKVPSPAGFSNSAAAPALQLQTSVGSEGESEIFAQPHNRAGKNTVLNTVTTDSYGFRTEGSNEGDSWYFANYNRTNLEPYVGPGGGVVSRGSYFSSVDTLGSILVWLFVVQMMVY